MAEINMTSVVEAEEEEAEEGVEPGLSAVP